MRRASLSGTIMLVVFSMLLGGCGSDQTNSKVAKDSKAAPEAGAESYESTVHEVHDEMNSAMSAAFASQQLDAQLVRVARTTATRSLKQMAAATAPTRYRSAHDEYTAGLTTFAAILADVEGQVNEPDVARRHLGDKRFSTGVAHLEKATSLYDEAGLDLNAAAESG